MSESRELELIAAELEAVGREQGWTDVADGAERWSDPDRERELLIAASADADLDAFQTWLKSSSSGLRICTVPLATLAANAASVTSAERILIALTAGRLLQPLEVDCVGAAMTGRTFDDACIVFTHAERLGARDDLEKLDRGAWRLLVPEPKPGWDQPPLGEQGIFLWAEPDTCGFVRQRVESDAGALAGWAREGGADRLGHEASRAKRLLALIGHAQALLPAPEDPAPSGQTGDEEAARSELDDLGQRLQARMDADLEAVLRQENVSLDALEQEVDRGLAARTTTLADRLTSPPRKFAETVLHPFIVESFARWESTERKRLGDLGTTLDSETKTLLCSVDWKRISRALGPNGTTETLPFRGRGAGAARTFSTPYASVPPNGTPLPVRDWFSTFPAVANRNALVALPVVVLVAVSGGVAAWLLGPPIISVALAGGAGLWAGGTFGSMTAANRPETARSLARSFVHEHIARTKQNAARLIAERFALVKRQCQDEIGRLQGIIASNASAIATPPSSPQAEVSARLARLRDRILSTLEN